MPGLGSSAWSAGLDGLECLAGRGAEPTSEMRVGLKNDETGIVAAGRACWIWQRFEANGGFGNGGCCEGLVGVRDRTGTGPARNVEVPAAGLKGGLSAME